MSSLFCLPTMVGLAVSAVTFTLLLALDLVLRRLFGIPTNWGALSALAIYLVAIDCVHHPLLKAAVMIFYLWWCTGGKDQWPKLRKRLAQKLSSMTEVGAAAFKRQQAEAFS